MKRRKKFFFLSLMVVALSVNGAYKSFNSYKERIHEDDMFMLENVEALAADSNGENGITFGHVCSRKPGKILCTPQRGKRKWAIELTFHIGNSFECSECEDDDYEVVYD